MSPELSTIERIGLPPFPMGWYRIASCDDVGPGELITLQAFGQEIICWRAEDGGEARVFDAFCAHLGAHIGCGGFVAGGTLVCPFHHWRYDGSGCNVQIPYRDKPQRAARLTRWRTLERNGQILVWNGPHEPDWLPPAIPEADDAGFVRIESERTWTIRTHVQEIFENSVDVSHFQFVHGVTGFGAVELVEQGPMFRSTAAVTMETSRGIVEGAVESELWGLGLDVVRQVGVGDARSIFWIVPLDDERVTAGHTFFVRRAQDGDGPSKYGRGFMREFSRQLDQDIPIWEHKRYRKQPRLAMGEGAIVDFRRWAEQFYLGAAA
jgi:phenylpropionate dioxygenase-like ring-hydroxylating dioxygenase large terminal subunit